MAARKHPKFLNINNNSLAAMIRGGTDAGVVDTVRRQTLLDKVSSDLRDTLAHLG